MHETWLFVHDKEDSEASCYLLRKAHTKTEEEPVQQSSNTCDQLLFLLKIHIMT